MKIFVTGATGVLGRPTVRLLTAAGHQVRALARSEKNIEVLTQLGVEPVRGSLFDPAAVRKGVEGCAAALHLATSIPSSTKIRMLSAWKENDRIRTEGTRLLAEAAVEAGVGTLIYPSVVFLYPDGGDGWIDEDAPAVPSPHVRSTIDAEREVARFQSAGRRGITLRMGRFYGPQSWDAADAIKAARRGLAMIPGRAEGFIPMIWVADAARAVVAALDRAPSGIFNIVDNEPLRLREQRAVLAEAAGRKKLFSLPPILVRLAVGSSLNDMLTRSQRVSNRRFREATGWTPAVLSAREGWRLMASASAAGNEAQAEDAIRT